MPAAATDVKKERRRRFFRLTLPFVKSTLIFHWKLIITLAIIGVVLGIVPTIKTELESGLIDKLANTLSDTTRIVVKNVAGTKLDRFQNTEADDMPEKITRFLLRDVTISSAVLLYLFIALFAFGVEYINQRIRSGISKNLFSSLRGIGVRKGLLTDPSDIPSVPNGPGQYSSAIQQGATNVSNTYGYLLDGLQYLFAFSTTLYLVWTKSYIFALACLLLLGVQISISMIQARRLAAKRKRFDKIRNELFGRTDDILDKRDILVAYEQDGKYAEELDTITGNYAELERKLEVSEAKYKGLSDLVTDYGRIGILIILVVIVASAGRGMISGIGDIYFLIQIYFRLLSPASNLLLRYDSIKRSETTSDTFLEVLDDHLTSLNTSKPAASTHQWTAFQPVKFKKVDFYYTDPSQKVLSDCSFVIPARKVTLLLGPSGCGKSTIAKIILKFWPVRNGTVEAGGLDINKFRSTDVRSQMSYVSQGDYVTDDTIGNNLRWATPKNPPLKEQEMRAAIESLNIKLKKPSSDILHEKASELSIGQQQRLSVARMMLDHSEIVILDEPLAGVDVFTLRDILPILRDVLTDKDKTVLLISHRLVFTGIADHVIILSEKGSVEEQGSPEELMKNGKIFPGLYATALNEVNISWNK